MSQAPPIVAALIDRFEQNRESYKSQGYNETQVRREFLDPFFEALGWDVANKQGYAEAYKDVIHEDAIKIGGNTKAPDYCFRIGGARKFFLEAKKPSVNVKDENSPAYQLRRYAWSAKLPLSILTDFEEFAVYDCRTRPTSSDKPSTGRIFYLTYRDYLAKWDEIASIFTKEAVLKGSFDKYAVTDRKRGTATVDVEFLKDIETWREALAKNLAVRNPTLSVHELNFAVQRTIDRLIFLRICEDRGIEPLEQLRLILNGKNIYDRLQTVYQQADDRYNSGLFHFHPDKDRAESPDDLTPRLKIDDKILKDIIGRLYYPQSPYAFSVFPTEILGQVYEQFLGKVIRLTSGHQAKVEEKPEVKKAGGVYYTPVYIVEYIVKHTVGALCESKTPAQITKLYILDPACGSGSFLLGAYSYLLAWHQKWYVEHGPERYRKELFKTMGGDWRLKTTEKRRILLNNIYGVDIDSQAVEVTKLSLLLKVLDERPVLIEPASFARDFPLAWKYLNDNSSQLKARGKNEWYAFRRRNYDLRDGVARILVPSIGRRLSAAVDPEGQFHFVGSGGGGGGSYGLVVKGNTGHSIFYILGLLKSKLGDWLAKLANSRFGGGYYSFNRQYIETIPIWPIDFKSLTEKTSHDRMVGLVERMLDLHIRLADVAHPDDKTRLQRQIGVTDQEIDRLVYDIYGLTEEEIKIVESASVAYTPNVKEKAGHDPESDPAD